MLRVFFLPLVWFFLGSFFAFVFQGKWFQNDLFDEYFVKHRVEFVSVFHSLKNQIELACRRSLKINSSVVSCSLVLLSILWLTFLSTERATLKF